MEYASKGVANAGLTTGIIGTALGALNSGGLGGILGGGWNNYGCSENIPVNRYEAGQNAKIAELETEIKLRDANIYTDSKLNDLRNYMERRLDTVEHQLCDQRVYNATLNGTVSCISGQIAQLYGLTKLVVPNSSICPGWDTTTTPTTTG
jgi:hypothetical protein